MTEPTYLWTAPPAPSLPVRGKTERAPVNRLFFVGRNYHAHALEMGNPIDKSTARPFYFTKAPQTLVESGATTPYPSETANYHHELELVVVLGKAGFRVAAADAHELIYGYACGLDMTRRDLQMAAREKGRPWDLAKDIENGSVIAEIVPMQGIALTEGELVLSVNGEQRQKSDVKLLIWSIREVIEDLSKFYHLHPGDLIYTGTPDGVGPVVPGDRLEGRIAGVGEISLTIGEPE